MAFGSVLNRGLSLSLLAAIVVGCSTDSLMPTASVDRKAQVNSIGPLELEGPVGSRQTAYQAPADPVSAASQTPVDPYQNGLVTVPPKKRLPMIDSEEAAASGIDTSMGVQPLALPDQPQAQNVEVASAAQSSNINIAEVGTSEPVVDGIGTDAPRLVTSPARQSANPSSLPITWSDDTTLPVDESQPEMQPQPRQQPQQVAMLPRLNNPAAAPAQQAPRQQTPMQMSADDIQCRRALQSLGVQFQDLAPISQGPTCGIPHPIKVSGFDRGRIRFYPAATLNCPVTLQFAQWVRNELVPSARLRYWSGVKSIRQMSAYSCRRMNSDPNNPWSEHAKGNAIDIGTITLNNGHEIDVEKKGLFSFREGALLKAVRTDSCKYFDTVLGPGSNKYHKDHFHFDLRDRRGGRKYCD